MNATTTRIFLLVLVCALVLYDAIIIPLSGFDASVSVVIYEAAKTWPIVPFLFGVIMGHFFFPITKDMTNPPKT